MAPASTPYPFYTPRRQRARTDDCAATASVPLHSADDPYADYLTSSNASSSSSSSSSRQPRGKEDALLGCLYPGATFVGTQRSGQFAYDVTVTLATVSASTDASEPHLCGYLKIRGLTDEHPELTTYFDAEVIAPGSAGPAFRTPRTWGACEARDWQHWTRFPAFQRLELADLDHRPPLESIIPPSTPEYAREAESFPHGGGGGAVFMRWKERFLVPDHRVKDISGASFAGFYYVCVEAPGPSAHPAPSPPRQRASAARTGTAPAAATAAAAARRRTSRPHNAPPEPDLKPAQDDAAMALDPAPAPAAVPVPVPAFVSSPNSLALGVRDMHAHHLSPSPSAVSSSAPHLDDFVPAQPHHEPEFDSDEFELDDLDVEDPPPPGTGALMCGYYFHPHSDPFQKLTLRHVPELDGDGSTFEFR